MKSKPTTDICVIIKGAGEHGIVTADILWQMHHYKEGIVPIGFIDDNSSLVGERHMELEVLGTNLAEVTKQYDAVVVAIGENRIRMRNFYQLKESGSQFVSAVHPKTIVAESAVIGMGTMVCAGAIVNPFAKIGSNVILNTGCIIDHHNTIGDHVHIAPGVNIGGDVRIGNGTLVGIGARILPGVSIGKWSIIAAGAVVTSDVEDGDVVCGIPAKRINRRK